MKIKSFLAIGIVFLLVVMNVSAWADVPQVINYQGYLTDVEGNPVPDDSYLMKFHLYNAEAGGSELWNGLDGEEHDVYVENGVYNVKLGSQEPFPAGLFENNPALYLEVEIENSEHAWETMAPRQQLTSTPYAMKAAQADGVPDGAIKSVMLDSDAITEEKIADNAINIDQISNGAVSPSKLGGTPGNGTSGQILQSNGNGTFSWKTASSADGHSLDAADGAPANSVYVDNYGNVGIGTLSPFSKLEIAGDLMLSGNIDDDDDGNYIDLDMVNNIKISSNESSYIDIDTDNNSTSEYFGITSHNGGSTLLRVQENGNVGIGTTSPTGRLDIRGDEVRIWDGTGIATHAIAQGSLYVQADLEVDDDIYLADSIIHGLDTNTYIDFNEDRVITFAGGARLIDAYEGTQDYVKLGNGADVDINLNDDMFIQGSSSRMGIGTTTPGAKLHIKGDNYPDSFVFFDTTAVDQDSGFRFYENGVHRGGMYHNAGNDAIELVTIDGSTWNRLVMKSNGNVGIGTSTPDEKLDVNGTAQVEILKITGGSDLAEPFDIRGSELVKPGTVLVIDTENEGKLKIAHKAYDRLVAGVVSGAGGVNTGLMMGQEGSVADGASPVALTGRIYCQADASNGPIEPGDMLTTSETPGHAMKVTDYNKAQGAILGKAMSSLEDGQGLVLILVTLQ